MNLDDWKRLEKILDPEEFLRTLHEIAPEGYDEDEGQRLCHRLVALMARNWVTHQLECASWAAIGESFGKAPLEITGDLVAAIGVEVAGRRSEVLDLDAMWTLDKPGLNRMRP